MNDRTGHTPIRYFAHVKVMKADNERYMQTGTVVRIDRNRRRIWVAFPGGQVAQLSPLAVTVITPSYPRSA